MTVDELYILWKYCLAKNSADGYASPEDFNLTIRQGERSYLDFLLGQYQKYMPGRPQAPVSFAQNERVRTSLIPLIYSVVLPINSTTGIAPYPSDFEQVDAMWSVYGFYRIRFTQQDSLWSKYHSVIDPIASNPVYLLKDEGFQFYFETIGMARMSYIRDVPYMNWGYTLDSNGLPVYDPATSTQPIWADVDCLNILVRALDIAGVNLQFPIVLQYSNDIKKSGQ